MKRLSRRGIIPANVALAVGAPMFTCKDSVHLLIDFLDGDMSEDEQRHLREHLQGCPPCVDFLKTYKATPALCRKALAKQMPAELSSKLTEFLRSKMKSST